MTDTRLEMIQQIAAQITSDVITGLQETVRCCIHCRYWQAQQELCNNPVNCPVNPARPPATFIAFGCAQYEGTLPWKP